MVRNHKFSKIATARHWNKKYPNSKIEGIKNAFPGLLSGPFCFIYVPNILFEASCNSQIEWDTLYQFTRTATIPKRPLFAAAQRAFQGSPTKGPKLSKTAWNIINETPRSISIYTPCRHKENLRCPRAKSLNFCKGVASLFMMLIESSCA